MKRERERECVVHENKWERGGEEEIWPLRSMEMNKNRPCAEGIREQIVYCFFEIEIDESERLWDWDIWVLFLFWNLVIILLINGFGIVVVIKKDLEICNVFRDLYFASDSVSVSFKICFRERERKKVVFRSSERIKNRERRRRRILVVLFTSSGKKEGSWKLPLVTRFCRHCSSFFNSGPFPRFCFLFSFAVNS